VRKEEWTEEEEDLIMQLVRPSPPLVRVGVGVGVGARVGVRVRVRVGVGVSIRWSVALW
jgi:hypothetical protein